MTTLTDLQRMTQQVVAQIKTYQQTGTASWTYETAIKDLPVQVGSLVKLGMQLKGERFAHGLSKDDLHLKISDELADILSCVLFIAHELSIDMEEAWDGMIASDDQKIKSRV